MFIIDDGAGGTNRKVTASRIKTYAESTLTPAFYVDKGDSGNQDISNQTQTTVTWDTERVDPDNKFASNVFTPAVAGYYHVGANVLIETGNAAGEYGDLGITRNGTKVLAMRLAKSGDTNISGWLGVHGVIFADADDTIGVSIWHNHGSTQTIDANNDYTYFWGYRLPGWPTS